MKVWIVTKTVYATDSIEIAGDIIIGVFTEEGPARELYLNTPESDYDSYVVDEASE